MQALPDYRLRLTFVDSRVYTVSLANEFDKFPGLAPLRDAAAFAKACIIEGEGELTAPRVLEAAPNVDGLPGVRTRGGAGPRPAMLEDLDRFRPARDLARRFEEALEQARDEPVSRPTRDFDLD